MEVHYAIYDSFSTSTYSLTLYKAKIYKGNFFNEDALSKFETKQIEAFAALGIVFHHMAQQTCAPWLPSNIIVHGLDPFLNMGYLFVSVFFFFSGYGLYVSLKSKENYFDRFFIRRLAPIAYFYVVSNALFYTFSKYANGYTWFVYAIVYLYIAFYISFKFIKKESMSYLMLTLFIAIWMFACDYLVIGTWVYNSILVFLFGLVFAKCKEKIITFFKKHYLACLLITILIFTLLLLGSSNLEYLMAIASDVNSYELYLRVNVIAQNFAGMFFSLLLVLINMKVSLRNKALKEIGTMTLGLYLIHPLFAQMFSYGFEGALVEGIYIKSILLYVLVVFLVSVPVTMFLYYLYNVIVKALSKYDNVKREFKKDTIRTLIIIAVILVVSSIAGIASHSKEKALASKVRDTYVKENITYTNALGKMMATYISGNGEKTIVYLRGSNDPCPTLTMKRFADVVGQDYKVVIIDFLGEGFSEDPDTERTAENITNEIHDGLKNLGINKYILMSHGYSEIYSRLYANKFPDEIELICNTDSLCLEAVIENVENEHGNKFDLQRSTKSEVSTRRHLNNLMQTFGYDRFFWPTVEYLYEDFTEDEKIMIKYMYFNDEFNKTRCEEQINIFQNSESVSSIKYPNDILVLDFITQELVNQYVKMHVDLIGHHKNAISNLDNYICVESLNTDYFIIGDQNSFKVLFNKYMDKIYGHH